MTAHKKAPTSGQLAKAKFSKLPVNYNLFATLSEPLILLLLALVAGCER
jgi:hypothetical protein